MTEVSDVSIATNAAVTSESRAQEILGDLSIKADRIAELKGTPKTEQVIIKHTNTSYLRGEIRDKEAITDWIQTGKSQGSGDGAKLLQEFADSAKGKGAEVLTGSLISPGALNAHAQAFGEKNLQLYQVQRDGSKSPVSYDQAMQTLKKLDTNPDGPLIRVEAPLQQKIETTLPVGKTGSTVSGSGSNPNSDVSRAAASSPVEKLKAEEGTPWKPIDLEKFKGMSMREREINGQHQVQIDLDTHLSDLDTSQNAKLAGMFAYSGMFPNLNALDPQMRSQLNNYVQQNLLDIVRNSVDAARDQGRSTVEITFTGGAGPNGTFSLNVRDDGPGFPQKIIDRYNDPFTRNLQKHVPISSKTDDPNRLGGKGLGLSQIHEHISQGLGGTVTLGNAPEGGASITMQFPLNSNPSGAGATFPAGESLASYAKQDIDELNNTAREQNLIDAGVDDPMYQFTSDDVDPRDHGADLDDVTAPIRGYNPKADVSKLFGPRTVQTAAPAVSDATTTKLDVNPQPLRQRPEIDTSGHELNPMEQALVDNGLTFLKDHEDFSNMSAEDIINQRWPHWYTFVALAVNGHLHINYNGNAQTVDDWINGVGSKDLLADSAKAFNQFLAGNSQAGLDVLKNYGITLDKTAIDALVSDAEIRKQGLADILKRAHAIDAAKSKNETLAAQPVDIQAITNAQKLIDDLTRLGAKPEEIQAAIDAAKAKGVPENALTTNSGEKYVIRPKGADDRPGDERKAAAAVALAGAIVSGAVAPGGIAPPNRPAIVQTVGPAELLSQPTPAELDTAKRNLVDTQNAATLSKLLATPPPPQSESPTPGEVPLHLFTQLQSQLSAPPSEKQPPAKPGFGSKVLGALDKVDVVASNIGGVAAKLGSGIAGHERNPTRRESTLRRNLRAMAQGWKNPGDIIAGPFSVIQDLDAAFGTGAAMDLGGAVKGRLEQRAQNMHTQDLEKVERITDEINADVGNNLFVGEDISNKDQEALRAGLPTEAEMASAYAKAQDKKEDDHFNRPGLLGKARNLITSVFGGSQSPTDLPHGTNPIEDELPDEASDLVISDDDVNPGIEPTTGEPEPQVDQPSDTPTEDEDAPVENSPTNDPDAEPATTDDDEEGTEGDTDTTTATPPDDGTTQPPSSGTPGPASPTQNKPGDGGSHNTNTNKTTEKGKRGEESSRSGSRGSGIRSGDTRSDAQKDADAAAHADIQARQDAAAADAARSASTNPGKQSGPNTQSGSSSSILDNPEKPKPQQQQKKGETPTSPPWKPKFPKVPDDEEVPVTRRSPPRDEPNPAPPSNDALAAVKLRPDFDPVAKQAAEKMQTGKMLTVPEKVALGNAIKVIQASDLGPIQPQGPGHRLTPLTDTETIKSNPNTSPAQRSFARGVEQGYTKGQAAAKSTVPSYMQPKTDAEKGLKDIFAGLPSKSDTE